MTTISSSIGLIDGDTQPSAPTATGQKLFYIRSGSLYSLDTSNVETPLLGQPADATLTALAANDWAANSIPVGTGANTLAQTAVTANTFLARASAGNVLAKPITDAGLTFVAAADATAETALLNVATVALKGLMSSTDKAKLDDLWIDITYNSTASVVQAAVGTTGSGTGGATANSTALNAIYQAAPSGCVLYAAPCTPGNAYNLNAEVTMNRDIRLSVLGTGKGRSVFCSVSTTANMFNQTVAGFYISFDRLSFTSSVTKTAGSAIVAIDNNALFDVRSCEFTGQFQGVIYSGANSPGNLSVVFDCVFSSPSSTANGAQLKIDGPNINIQIHLVTINVTGVSTRGMEIDRSGAVQVSTCDFIGGANTLLINSSAAVSATFFTNVFFDQATLGSTVKITGAFAISRCKFVQCGITNGGGSGLVALEIAGSGSGTAIPDALDFVNCDFYNNGFAGTTTGVLVTGCRAFSLIGCRIAGFTFGVDITSYNAAGITSFNITSCRIGPTENFNANGTGIRINVGSFTYGASEITANDLSGNTTAALTDNGAYVGNALFVANNIGLAMPPKAEMPGTLIPLTTPVTRAGSGWSLPANVLRIGAHLQITVELTSAATAQTLTPSLKMGVNNTNADTDLITATALGASGGAVVGSMLCVYDVFIVTATTVLAFASFINNNNGTGTTGITNLAIQARGSTAPVTITNINTAQFLAPYFVSATAAAVTVRSIDYAVVAQ